MEACYTVGVNQSDDAFGAARDLARDLAHDIVVMADKALLGWIIRVLPSQMLLFVLNYDPDSVWVNGLG